MSFFLIFFLVVLSSSPGVHPLIKTPPLFICDGATNDLDDLIPSCPNICNVPETSTPTAYQLYESVITTDSYIARCVRVKASRIFYESYVFTRSASETVRTNLPPILDSCTQIFKEVCKLRECSTPEPKLTEEYRWGKDTEVVLDYHLVTASMKSVPISIDQPDPKILINKDMVPISDGHYRPPTGNVIYLWDKDMTKNSEKCPFEKSPDVIGCYPANHEMIWCPDLGVYLDVAKVFTDKRCSDKEIVLSTSGILYANSTSPINVTHHNIIPLPSDSSKESEALLASINSWIYRLDHNECLTSCLQSRQPGIHIIGQQSLKSDGHNYTLCSKTVACRLMEPLTICGRPFLVKVMCGTGQYWWNPGQEFVESVSECKALLSKLPSSETQIGVIKMNRSGVYYMPAAFMSEIPTTLKGYINVQSWLTHAKDIKLDFQPHQEIREQQVPFSRTTTNDEHRSWLGEIWDKVTGFPRFIKNKFHEISDWIKTISVVIVCGFVIVYLLVRYLRVTRALKSKIP